MAGIGRIEQVAYQSDRAEETLKVWRLSLQRALGLREHNEADDFSNHLRFLQQIPPANITLAVDNPWASDPAQLKDIRYQWLADNP